MGGMLKGIGHGDTHETIPKAIGHLHELEVHSHGDTLRPFPKKKAKAL